MKKGLILFLFMFMTFSFGCTKSFEENLCEAYESCRGDEFFESYTSQEDCVQKRKESNESVVLGINCEDAYKALDACLSQALEEAGCNAFEGVFNPNCKSEEQALFICSLSGGIFAGIL